MSLLVRGNRPTGRGGARGQIDRSVREVCLLGVAQPAAGWESGERLVWGGRIYRISATHSLAQARDDERVRYVHLTASGPMATRSQEG